MISHCSVFYCVTTRWGMENANTPSEQPTLLYQCVCSYSLEHHLCHLFWWSVSFRSPQQRWFGVNVANCSSKRVVSIAYICFCFLRSADVHIHSIVNHFVIFLFSWRRHTFPYLQVRQSHRPQMTSRSPLSSVRLRLTVGQRRSLSTFINNVAYPVRLSAAGRRAGLGIWCPRSTTP